MRLPARLSFWMTAAGCAVAALCLRAEEPKPPAPATAADARAAVAAMRDGKWPAARDAWRKVIAADPDNAAALSNLGRVEWKLGELQDAVAHLERSAALKPELAATWTTLGLVYLDLQATMRAVSCMTRAVAESPADPAARNSLAIVLKQIGWTDGAESELLNAIDLKPDYAEAHFNLAVMYLDRKPPALELARRHYALARELGAEPDTLVEKQLQGETEIEEAADPVKE